MQTLIILCLVACSVLISGQQHLPVVPSSSIQYTSDPGLCNVNRDYIRDYRSATYDFCLFSLRPVAVRSNFNFVYSPISIWTIVAAIAEGADPLTQQKLFQLLHLPPHDPCLRYAFYQLATSRAIPSNEVNIRNNRILLINEGTTLNPTWHDIVVKNSLLDVVTAPIKYNSVATANEIKRIMSARLPTLDLSGNSVLLDTIDYNGLWTTAFADAVIERAPFYSPQGEVLGSVDMMRVRRRARMGYIKAVNAKVLELSVGSDERYRMIFGVVIGNADIKPVVAAVTSETVFQVIDSLRESAVPIDVAIPRMVISSEIDVRVILKDLGITEIFTDPAATRYISDPPAFPSSFLQRTTFVLNSTGLYTPPQEPDIYNAPTGLDLALGRDFIADRPFLFGLFDVETYTCIMAAAYTSPTYI
ncbi:serpin-Z10-like [Spodoptera litura]|uniref:Serpin-Z10-like n=1 Tax=Spodoptera litura TaxID=69820 RepID=A0A9J7EXH8_SPOLT|nr:serpin-Z10-like [Spodoptera litura]